MKMGFCLANEEYKKCLKFPIKLWYAGKSIGDWRSTGTRRTLGQYLTNHTMGKLAEISFSKFLEENWSVKSELDFNIYPGSHAIDSGDLVCIWAMVDLNGYEKCLD